MPTVLPSQVVKFIDGAFPWAAAGLGDKNGLDFTQVGRVSALVALTDQVPASLLVLGDDEFAEFVANLAVLRSRIPMWEHHGNAFPVRKGIPVQRMRELLAKCPDSHPSPKVHALAFVSDTALRADLRTDINSIDRALGDGEWKTATVLAGATIEALLLWRLSQNDPDEVRAVENALVSSKVLNRKPRPFDEWGLHDLVEVAAAYSPPSSLIRKDTAIQARLAKDYRNLIHPGKSSRLAQKCSRATALAAAAALDRVIEDLS
jgi:hypothetical protein